jgi:Putative motility protein
MDVAAASAFKQGQIDQQVQIAVARKQLDAQKQQGQAALALLQSATGSTGGPSPDGVGARVDVAG